MGIDEILIAPVGEALRAPKGTALPNDIDDALNGAFISLGSISDAGVTLASQNDVKSFKNSLGDVVRKKKTSDDRTYKIVFIETNSDVLETYFGSQDDPDSVIEVKAQDGIRQSWVFEYLDGDTVLRDVIPDGEVIEVGDIVHSSEELLAYEVTISCYPDDTGVKVYKYRDAVLS